MEINERPRKILNFKSPAELKSKLAASRTCRYQLELFFRTLNLRNEKFVILPGIGMTMDHPLLWEILLHKEMKIITQIFLTILCFSVFLVGQIEGLESEMHDPSVNVKNAYESKDIIRIKEICNNVSLQDLLVAVILKEPKSEWKDQVIIELLDAPWHLDRVSGKPTPPGTPPIKLYHIAVEFLAPLLPEEVLKINDDDTYRKLSNFDERKRLVEKYRKSRKGRSGIREMENNSANEPNPHGDSRIHLGNDLKKLPVEEQRSGSKEPEYENKNEGNSVRIIGLGILIGVPLLILLFRQWRTKQPN
jgi:hypothetical protein